MSRRIELGISLEQAARDTNIRARMLEIIESCDYAQYPPRGYAIGMLSSYARYLGLDSALIIEAFDAEYESFSSNQEIAQMANNTRRGVGRFGERISEGKSRPINREPSRARSQRRRGGAQPEPTSKLSQNLKDEALAKDDERYKSGSVRVVGTRQTGSFKAVRGSRPSSPSRTGSIPPSSSASFRKVPSNTGSMHRTGQTGSMQRLSGTGSMPRFSAQDSFKPVNETADGAQGAAPNYFGVDVDSSRKSERHSSRRRSSTREPASGPRESSVNDTIFTRARTAVGAIFSETRTRIIAIAAIIAVVAIIVVASILISTAGHANSGIIAVQGGADNETLVSDGDNASHKTITTANGNPVAIKVEVARGETSLIEVTYDGANAYKGAAVGLFEQEWLVSESFSATFSNPSAVTVTENGNPIEIPLNEDGKSGSLYISIQASPK